ncbi:hypothetical protein RchiOBHm_Chr5g0019501 [Rosa chinensis]|uniref:Uncharacterized protein n=1 Tax=Rosa chinensis TaxID=74649 RepID=A0A2P6Q705_ROSCH|nr:hypothetical protein RchiOBHm_Chr5g0019501 [Rosa chinensis]
MCWEGNLIIDCTIPMPCSKAFATEAVQRRAECLRIYRWKHNVGGKKLTRYNVRVHDNQAYLPQEGCCGDRKDYLRYFWSFSKAYSTLLRMCMTQTAMSMHQS